MISEDNRRICSIVSKEVFKKLEKQADFEDRSISNLVFKILKEYYGIKTEE